MNKNIRAIFSIVAVFAVFASVVSMPMTATALTSQLPTLPTIESPVDPIELNDIVIESKVCQITVDDDEVEAGNNTVTVSWSTSGYGNVTVNGKPVGPEGNMTFRDLEVSTLYVLEADNSQGATCTQQVNVTCVPPPQECILEINKVVDKSTAKIGDELTYTITIKNIGDADCTGGGVKIYDIVDANLTYLSHTLTSNLSAGYGTDPVYTESDRTLRFNGHVLNPGESGTIHWVGEVNEQTQCGDFEVYNQAKATALELNNFNDWVYSQRVQTDIDNECVTPEPECTLLPATQTVDYGASAALTWTSTNADTVTITDFGTVDLDGTDSTDPLYDDKTYTLTATGYGKEVKCYADVIVEKEPPVPPECPLGEADGRTIVNFEGLKLRTDRGINEAQTAVVPVSLAAGEYDITLVSWDGYLNRINTYQPNEQWALEFINSGTPIAQSGIIGDLEDNVVEAMNVEKVNTGFVLTSATDGLRAVHPFYPDVTSANSLYPICAAIDENPVVVRPSCDLFEADPVEIYVGATSTLTWESTNTVQAFINNAVGAVDVDGSVDVSPLVDTTYILTLIGVEDSVTDCEVEVKVKEESVPSCKYFSASPALLPVGGGSVTLSWEALNATMATITPTIGAVDLLGTTTVSVTESTTFVLDIEDADGNKNSCEAPVAVSDPTPFTCANNVSFTASDYSIVKGSNSTLTWSTVDIDAVSISVINETATSGTRVVIPADDTTYVLTATKGTESINCPLTINVDSGGGGGSASPRCDLDISDTKINRGDEITITWDTTYAREVTLTDDEGEVLFTTDDYLSDEKEDYYDGSIKLKPTRNTEYTLLVERGSKDRECKVEVEMEDDVVVLQSRDQQPLVAGISLSQVPYTGFEAGPIMTLMFYTLLIAWALYITYLLVVRNSLAASVSSDSMAGVSVLPTRSDKVENNEDLFAAAVATPTQGGVATTPTNLPVATPVIGYENDASEVDVNPHQVNDIVVTELENRAHQQMALLSSDAVRHFVATTEGDVERNESLDAVIAEAKRHYPLEDGWIVINEARMKSLCVECLQNQAVPTKELAPSTVPEGTGSLAEAIVTGNVVAAYEMIGSRPMFALADAAADLDAVYRNRCGGKEIVSDMLTAETKNLSEAQIKAMIKALTGALDGTYTDEASAVKMAIMKAVKAVS